MYYLDSSAFFGADRALFFKGHRGRRINVGMRQPRYRLAPGTQVREEDFGLLFYTMKGPQLYFLPSGQLLKSSFFQGDITLEQYLLQKEEKGSMTDASIRGIRKTLDQLSEKGVIFEC